MTSSTPFSHDDLSLLLSTKARLEPLRHDFQNAAIDYKRERQKSLRYAENGQRIFKDVLTVVDQLIAAVAVDTAPEIINKLHVEKSKLAVLSTEYDDTIGGLTHQDRECAEVEDRMASDLYSMEQLESQLCPALEAHLEHTGPEHIPSWSNHGDVYPQSSESQPLSPVVQELYERVGDYRNLLEDIHNWEWALHQELDERDALRASGFTGLNSDEDFLKERKEFQQQLHRDLDKAETDIRRLRRTCLREGLHFDDIAFPLAPSNSSVESLTLSPGDAAHPNLTEPTTDTIITFFATKTRVAAWVNEAEAPEPPTQPEGLNELQEAPEVDETDIEWDMVPSRRHTPVPASAATIHKIRDALQQMHLNPPPIDTLGPPKIGPLPQKSTSEMEFKSPEKDSAIQLRSSKSFEK